MTATRTTSTRADPSRRQPPVFVLAAAAAAVLLFALPLIGLVQRADWGNLLEDLRAPASTAAMRLSLSTSLMATIVELVLPTAMETSDPDLR